MSLTAALLAEALKGWRAELLGDVQQMINRALGNLRAPARVVDVPLVIGSRGVVLAANDHVFLRLGLNGTATVLTWSLAGTVAGVSSARTCVIDVLTGVTLASVATICGGNRPALTAQAELADQPPTSWGVSIGDPIWLMAKVVSADGTLEEVSLTLRMAVDSR